MEYYDKSTSLEILFIIVILTKQTIIFYYRIFQISRTYLYLLFDTESWLLIVTIPLLKWSIMILLLLKLWGCDWTFLCDTETIRKNTKVFTLHESI